MNRRRLLVFTEYFYPEEFLLNELVLILKNKGFDITVLTQNPSYPFGKMYKGYKNKLFHKEFWNQIPVYRFFTITGYKGNVLLKVLHYLCFDLLGIIIGFFIGKSFDNVFIYHIGPLTTAIPGIIYGKLHGKNTYIWTQDVWPDSLYAYGLKKAPPLSTILDLFGKWAYGHCKKIFVSSENFSDIIRPYAAGKSIEFIPQWSNVAAAYVSKSEPADHKINNEQFQFTFAGNVGKLQNLENIIIGFSKVRYQNKAAVLNIVGDGSNLEYLKQLVRKQDITNVIFWGRLPLERMPEIFALSDALIISLVNDKVLNLTVPAKFQAYLTANKPIFCIMNGEVACLVRKYNLGLCADPDDTDDIGRVCAAFLKLATEEYNIFCRNSAALREEKYNKEKIILKLIESMESR